MLPRASTPGRRSPRTPGLDRSHTAPEFRSKRSNGSSLDQFPDTPVSRCLFAPSDTKRHRSSLVVSCEHARKRMRSLVVLPFLLSPLATHCLAHSFPFILPIIPIIHCFAGTRRKNGGWKKSRSCDGVAIARLPTTKAVVRRSAHVNTYLAFCGPTDFVS